MNTQSILPIEKINKSVRYTLTIAPCDDHQYFGATKAQDRLKLFHNWAQLKYYRLFINYEYGLNIEVSPKGRLHLHGYISFKTDENIKDFYLYTIHKLLSFNIVEIDTISDEKVWTEYCKKQSKYSFGRISSRDKISGLALIDVESEVIYKKMPLSDHLF